MRVRERERERVSASVNTCCLLGPVCPCGLLGGWGSGGRGSPLCWLHYSHTQTNFLIRRRAERGGGSREPAEFNYQCVTGVRNMVKVRNKKEVRNRKKR